MELCRFNLVLLWISLTWALLGGAQQNEFQIFKQEPPRNQQIYTPPLLPSASGRQINQYGGVQFSISTNVKSQATPQASQSDTFRGSHYQPPISNSFQGGFPPNPSQSNHLLHNKLPTNPYQQPLQHFSQNHQFSGPQIGSIQLSSSQPQKPQHLKETGIQHQSIQQVNPFSMRSFNDQGSHVQSPSSHGPSFSGYRPPLMPPLPSSAQFPSPSSGQQAIYVGGGQHQNHGAIPVPNTSQGISVSTSFSGNKERQSKVVESIPQVQAIQKAPASEIQFDKGSPAKDKAGNPDDEYVVYYYYYYDDDKQSNNNLTLNFDDIPNLESYDKMTPKSALPAARSASNSLDNKFLHLQPQNSGVTPSAGVSLSVSVKEDSNSFPISNIYRYGNNEIPKFPVTPNLLEVVKHTMAPSSTTMLPTPSPLTTQISNSDIQIINDIEDDIYDETTTEEPETTTIETTTLTTTTTTTEPPTTPTTTTTKRPRRTSFGGRGRPTKRAQVQKPSRAPVVRATTTSTTTSAPPSSPSSRSRSGVSRFNSNRLKRPFGKSRTVEDNPEIEPKPKKSSSTSTSTTTTTISPVSSKRFGAGSFRRTTSSRTTATTVRPSSGPISRGSSSLRSRPSSAPVFGRVNRNRPRPSFHRSRKPVESEEEEIKETVPPTTRTPEPTTTEMDKEALPLHEEDYYEDVDKHEPTTTTTTTRAPRRQASGIFRPRSRPSFLKPRPSRS